MEVFKVSAIQIYKIKPWFTGLKFKLVCKYPFLSLMLIQQSPHVWDGRSPQPLSQALFIWKTQNSFSHVMIPFVSGNISFNFGASNISGQFCLSAYVSFLYNPDLEVFAYGKWQILLSLCQTIS